MVGPCLSHSGVVSVKSCVDVNTGWRTNCEGRGEIIVAASRGLPCDVSVGRLGLEVATSRSVRHLTQPSVAVTVSRASCKGGARFLLLLLLLHLAKVVYGLGADWGWQLPPQDKLVLACHIVVLLL